MFRKVLLVCLFLSCALSYWLPCECLAQTLNPFPFERGTNREKADKLYKYVTNMWPVDPIWPDMRNVFARIADGNEANIQSSVDKLITDSAKNQYLPIALHEIAKLSWHFKNFDEALQLYKYVIDHWPSHEYAMWSQRDAARLNIELGRLQEAQSAVDKVLADFPEQKLISLVTYEIAEHYRQFKRFNKAKELYEYILKTWPTNWRVVLAQSGLARMYIDMGDEAAAGDVVKKLKTEFFDMPERARAIYLVGYRYDQMGKYDKAKPLYEYVLSKWPMDWYSMWSRSRLAVCKIALGDLSGAESDTNKLLKGFSSSERIAEAVYDIAHQYQGFGHYEKANQVYQHVLNTWPQWKDKTWATIGLAQSDIALGNNADAKTVVDGMVAKLNDRFPDDANLPGDVLEAYYYAGECYRELGDYAKSITCLEKVGDSCPEYRMRWKALFLIGRNYENLKKTGLITESQANLKIKAAYEQLLEKYPDCEVAETAARSIGRTGAKRLQIREITK